MEILFKICDYNIVYFVKESESLENSHIISFLRIPSSLSFPTNFFL